MADDGINKQACRKYIAAFADGELDVEQNLKVLEQMAMDPTNTRRVLHQQQLRKACARAMDGPEHRCPADLKNRIGALAGGVRADDAQPRPAVIASIGRWMPAAVAAVLLVGVAVAWLNLDRATRASGWAWNQPQLVSLSRAAMFEQRHKTCSSDLTALQDAIASPSHVSALPGTIDDYFGDSAGRIDTSLDLSVLGYDYQRVGSCTVPGNGAVQIVYRATQPDPEQAPSLSLWVRPDDGGLGLDPGRLYTAAERRDGRPLLIWTRHGRAYYLLGDSPADTRQAAQTLAARR